MLGFGALGEFALGEGPFVQTRPTGSQWQQPVKKTGLAVAVIATTFVGFVPPPQAQATPAFTQFSTPTRKPTIQQQPWLNALFVSPPPKAVFARFSEPPPLRRKVDGFTNAPRAEFVQNYVFGQFSQPQASRTNLPDEQPSALFEILPPQGPPFFGFTAFSQPQSGRSPMADEQPSALFEVAPPIAVPFVGFFNFGMPQFARYSFADQQAFTSFEIAPVPVDLGGGGDDRKRIRGGFERIKKRHPPPLAPQEPEKVWIPPAEHVRPPPIAPRLPAPDIVDPDLVPGGLLGIVDQMHTAEDISDINRFLAGLEQDEQDAADIADVLALLD